MLRHLPSWRKRILAWRLAALLLCALAPAWGDAQLRLPVDVQRLPAVEAPPAPSAASRSNQRASTDQPQLLPPAQSSLLNSPSGPVQTLPIIKLPAVARPAAGTRARAVLVPASQQNASPPMLSTSGGNGGGFPRLPPDPYEDRKDPLPPLAEELATRGSFLYETEDERRQILAQAEHSHDHEDYLRRPEWWREPQPLTAFTEFLSTGPIRTFHQWWGGGYAWEPRFVGYGSYSIFGFALEQNNQRQDVVGHQLLVDLDLRLTGTERFHVQFRPVGKGGSGGSYYQFSNPSGYVNNSSGTPDRYWAEGELDSLLGAYFDPFAPLDIHLTAGKFPVAMHNFLLINDDILGVAINKNTLYVGPFSNVNVQFMYAFKDVDTFSDADANLLLVNATADDKGRYWEATYAFVEHDQLSTRDQHFLALSRTAFHGPRSIASRALFKWGDEGGAGSGQLYVVESNATRVYDHKPMGVEKAVYYCNAFLATAGWNSIAGGNFNRLQTPFEVNPLVRIASGIPGDDTYGVSLGVQLFRHHQDESFAPEVSFEAPNGESVGGVGFRYRRQTTVQSFLEVFGAFTFSRNPLFDREGATVAHTVIF